MLAVRRNEFVRHSTVGADVAHRCSVIVIITSLLGRHRRLGTSRASRIPASSRTIPTCLPTLHEHALFAGGPIWGGVHQVDADIESHAHDFLEIAVIGAGRGRHLTSQGEHVLRQGEVVILRPGAWHGFRDCADLTVANCCLSAQALRAELAALHEHPDAAPDAVDRSDGIRHARRRGR